ncbi:hypothetical protein FJZ31_11865 [Candidatus Poribacteria bacterium]|nr:hypothetical protein [Candidatus Poribacteria bacterium]
MESFTISLPQKLGKVLNEKSEETGRLPDELAVEILCERLNGELDPKDLVEHYQVLSEKYLKDAQELLSKEDFVQASEKLWGATASTVKMAAAKRDLKLERHGSLWSFINGISKETGDKDFIRFFGEANALHRNFYENEMEKEAVETLAEDIERLIAKLKRVS